MMPGDFSRCSVLGKNTQWMIPSDRMVVRRYMPLRYFASMLEEGFRAGQADEYEEREGQASEPAREHERLRSAQTETITLNNGEEMDLAGGFEHIGSSR